MREYGDSYEDYLQPYMPKLTADPRVPFFSSVSGARVEGTGKLGPSYWRANMESPVLFNSALRSALRDKDGDMVIIEIGPHSALGGPIRQILGDLGRSDSYVGTLIRGKKCHESMLSLAGSLFQKNVSMDYSTICPPGNFLRNLPRYPWRQDTAHWAEPRVAHEWRFRDHPPHELLGNRVFDTGSEPIWKKVLYLEQVPWLKGHEVNTRVVFPAAAYISMAGEVLRQLENNTSFSIRNMKIMSH
jgi:acyl transferase domain-containing protein